LIPTAKNPAPPHLIVGYRKTCSHTAGPPSLRQGEGFQGEVPPGTATLLLYCKAGLLTAALGGDRPFRVVRSAAQNSPQVGASEGRHEDEAVGRGGFGQSGAARGVSPRAGGFSRQQAVFHTQQGEHHREQQAVHAAELQTVQQNLETFRAAAITAVDLAQTMPPAAQPAATIHETRLPPPNRKMVGRLIKLATESPGLAEPFGPTAVAAETNRRFAGRLPEPVGSRTASDVLRRMLAAGELRLVREGRPSQEALYARRRRQGG
jgi:hypothetical protein